MAISESIIAHARANYELVNSLTNSLPVNTLYVDRVKYLMTNTPDSPMWNAVQTNCGWFIKQFEPYAKKFAFKYSGYNFDDIYSECLMGLYTAALFYDHTRKAPFYVFAFIHMRDKVKTYLRAQNRYVSEKEIPQEEIDNNNTDVHKYTSMLYELVSTLPDASHRDIIIMTLEGYSQQEIAAYKKVSLSTISRVRTNFKRLAREVLFADD